MKHKSLGLTILVAAFAGSALAQNQVSGALKCGKAGASYSVEAGDQAGHMLVLEKGSCTWSVPLEIAGLKSTAWTGASTADVIGAKFQSRGYGVMTMENGDKAYVRLQDTGTAKEGVATYEGTWSFTGGTGELKGLRGKGTYKGSGAPDGPNETKVHGEYALSAASATAKKK